MVALLDSTRRSAESDSHHRRSNPTVTAVVMLAAGLSFVVAHDGTPWWRIVRLLTVAWFAARLLLAIDGTRRAPGPIVATGIAGSAVGVGISIPHFAKSGPLSMTCAGLLCLTGGLVLTGAGARLLLAGHRRSRQVPLAMAVVLGLALGWLTLGQAVAATNVPRPRLDRWPAEVGLPAADVELVTSDDVRLAAWYVAPTNDAAVILLHGAGSTRSAVLDQAIVLVRHGYGVLLVDARGHGASGGRAMDFGWSGDLDIAAALDFLSTQPAVDPARIAVLGLSMGGEEALGAAASDERIRAVVAEGATARTADDKAWMSDRYGIQGWLQRGLDQVTFGVADLLTEARPPIALHEAARAIAPRRVLLVVAGTVPEESHAADFITAASPRTVEQWVVPGAPHTGGLRTAPGLWEQRVIGFLERTIGPAAGS